jgi:hypothetical protein
MSSLGTDLAKTNFWRRKDVNGSFWGGILGGLLGELGGAAITVSLTDNPSPLLYYTSMWISSSLLTVLFYNLIGDGLAVPNELTNISIQPFVSESYGCVCFNMRF